MGGGGVAMQVAEPRYLMSVNNGVCVGMKQCLSCKCHGSNNGRRLGNLVYTG